MTPLEQREFAGAGDPARLLPPHGDDGAPFADGLRQRKLVLQRCGRCERFRYPVAPVCPYCDSEAHAWRELSGRGTVHSWIRYHRCYLSEFEPLMPYEVLAVTLAEGPRIFGRLCDRGLEPYIGMSVRAIVERCPSGACVPAFVAERVEESIPGEHHDDDRVQH